MRAANRVSDPDRAILVINMAYDAGWYFGVTGQKPEYDECTGACLEQFNMGLSHGEQWRLWHPEPA